MANRTFDAAAEKILLDLETAVKRDVSINQFDIIPTLEEDNKNSSPILRGENTLGLESWTVPHIYPYAYNQIMQKSSYKAQNIEKVLPCLLGVALLNPDMPIVWSNRRELILSKRLPVDNELRLTRMALSRKPKCNEALAHRRWILMQKLKEVEDQSNLLHEELVLSEMIANRYHSNFHAWSHRIWSIQHLLPDPPHRMLKKIIFREGNTEENSSLKLISCVISKAEFFKFVNTEFFRAYVAELENSLNWISSHVSDHSGLHYRSFLLTGIIEYLKSYPDVHKNELETEVDIFPNSHDQCDELLSFYTSRKINVIEFLKSSDLGNHYKNVIQEYLNSLESKISLFDIISSIIITELKINQSLCSVFSGHEALWYFRRFLIFSYKQYLHSFDDKDHNNESKICSHQDVNGVPHKKDLKYDFESRTTKTNYDILSSDLCDMFYSKILSHEKNVILTAINSSDDHNRGIVKNYSYWLKKFLQFEGDKFLN